MTNYLDPEALLWQLDRVGFVVRDRGLFLSCLERPRTTLFGEDAYPSLELKVAALMDSIVKNHPMIDGNKRTAWFTANFFVELNGYEFIPTEAYDFILSIATDRMTLDELAGWVESHLQPLDTHS